MPKLLQLAAEKIAREEGFRANPYNCSAGFLTVGYGLNCETGLTKDAKFLFAPRAADGQTRLAIKATLAKNKHFAGLSPARQRKALTTFYALGSASVSKKDAENLLRLRIDVLDKQLQELSDYADDYKALNTARKVAVLDMCYQMGRAGVRKFRKAIRAGRVGDWENCAREMMDSRWARQTPNRAKRNYKIIVSGKL